MYNKCNPPSALTNVLGFCWKRMVLGAQLMTKTTNKSTTYYQGATVTSKFPNKEKRNKKRFQEEEEGDQMVRLPLKSPPPLANCPFDIGINLLTSLCSNTSSSSSPLNILILFSS